MRRRGMPCIKTESHNITLKRGNSGLQSASPACEASLSTCAPKGLRDPLGLQGMSPLVAVQGFGFNILGGVDKPCHPGNFGIYVAKIRENESAALDGRLREGDKIMEAGGVSLVNILHEEAAKVFRNATKNELVLQIERQVGLELDDDVYSTDDWKPSQLCQSSAKGPQKWRHRSRTFYTGRLPWIILATSMVTVVVVMGVLKITTVKK